MLLCCRCLLNVNVSLSFLRAVLLLSSCCRFVVDLLSLCYHFVVDLLSSCCHCRFVLDFLSICYCRLLIQPLNCALRRRRTTTPLPSSSTMLRQANLATTPSRCRADHRSNESQHLRTNAAPIDPMCFCGPADQQVRSCSVFVPKTPVIDRK